ncbi:ABC-2 type transport system permease protein [Nakamurella panacisegetis]|uniref:Transport permease protein n=1 Tax=Nakamurella panacisegetis TaxID=1090615 RepID=A0A1H0MMQ0_9ACTN|nr:ABC transporter permease [Nakamurella panacisegetis]SDO81719.1 ABC-2 type transport system permease protein [Nakamurella panacisegetis]
MTTVGRRPHILSATIRRILLQLRHDRRTVVMIIGVPVMLIALLYFMFKNVPAEFNSVTLTMLAVFPFIIMFLLTSIAMLRERTSGTLERLMTTPTRTVDLLFGYGIAFGAVAAVQAAVTCACAYWLLGLSTAGGAEYVVLVAVLTALLGVGLGLLCSAFARTEFQAVQLLPVIVIPQILLCGLFVPRPAMAGWLEIVSDVMPLSYAVEACGQVGRHVEPTGLLWRDLAVMAGCVLIALLLASATLRRRTD